MIHFKDEYVGLDLTNDYGNKAHFIYKLIPPRKEWNCEENVQFLVDLGMIRKECLKVGASYKGYCRNSNVAKWNGESFEYDRSKFGSVYTDTVKHPQDDDGFDVFVPISMLDFSEFNDLDDL